jgi:hypothetical protein
MTLYYEIEHRIIIPWYIMKLSAEFKLCTILSNSLTNEL